MITKRIPPRSDGASSARAVLRYGEGLKKDKSSGELLNKSHRTRFSNFGLVDDGVYQKRPASEMQELIELASREMQACCALNTRAKEENKIAHFLFSFDQEKPSEAILRDTEDSMMSALGLQDFHWASFLHNDNGHWHAHLIVARIDRNTHRCNELWQDQTIRDRVAREIEIRHGLPRDNGLHEIDENGRIVQVPKHERLKRKGLKSIKTDRAQTTEIHSGEKTFQTWCEEIRIGDRLKHSKSWQDFHAAAAAYGCEIKQKGAGFIICPLGEKGGIQLSKLGLKNLTAKFGAFQPPNMGNQQINPVAAYKPEPTIERGASHYSKWQDAKKAFQPIKTAQLNELREKHGKIRYALKEQHRNELGDIRTRTTGDQRFAEVSLAKFQQAIQLSSLSDRFKKERQALYKELAEIGPGNSFRDYLVREAKKGDNAALGLARKYGTDEATDVSREHEAGSLRIRAAIAGQEYRPTPRLRFTHHIEPTGTVVYHIGCDRLGRKRLISDSATAKKIQLNDVAALDPEAIAMALRFATLKFGNTLTLTGSQEFQRLAVQTAVRERLSIRFTDPALEAYRQKLTEELHHTTTFNKEKYHAFHHRIERFRQIPPAHLRDRLYNMSPSDLVLDTSGHVSALRSDVSHRLEQPAEERNHGMQRAAGGVGGIEKDRIRTGANAVADNGSGDGKALPVTQTQELANLSAMDWAREWSKANNKKIVEPVAGAGKVPFTVVYVGQDGIVLDLGRRVAIYPVPSIKGLKSGDKVVVDRHMKVLLQKSQGVGLER